MKLRWLSLLFGIAATLAAAASPEVEFAGVMGTGAETRVLLATKERSAWVAMGKTFAGYVVSAYDPKKDVLTLKADGRELHLRLKESRVQAGAIELAPEVRQSIMNNLRQLGSAADQYYLENGKPRTTFDDLVGAGPRKYIKSITPVDGEDYRAIHFEVGKPLEVRTASGHTVTYTN